VANILVVEDYAVTQRLLGYILQVGGHLVTPAYNGSDALTKLSEHVFDLMIIDITMPTMDGLTLLHHIRADQRYLNLPIVMLTASGDDRHRREAMAGGASTFLTKPVSSTHLSSVVNDLLKVS
jgi:chemosensory pili system protein ChpA (sensor histidine kinase/response regulator)